MIGTTSERMIFQNAILIVFLNAASAPGMLNRYVKFSNPIHF